MKPPDFGTALVIACPTCRPDPPRPIYVGVDPEQITLVLQCPDCQNTLVLDPTTLVIMLTTMAQAWQSQKAQEN